MVVLHGCGTTDDQMAAASQYDALAERDRFIVLYPDVDTLVDECVRALLEGRPGAGPGGQRRRGRGRERRHDQGGPETLARRSRSRLCDRQGPSAGGHETAILAAYYPDLYAAIGIHSSTPYAGPSPAAFRQARTRPIPPSWRVTRWTRWARGARVMPVIVIHGDVDPSVPYQSGQQAIAQWLSAARQRRPAPGTPPWGAGLSGQEPRRRRPGRARIHGGIVCGWFGLRGRAAVDRARDRTLLVGRFGRILPRHGTPTPRGPSAATASWALLSRWGGLSGPLGPSSCPRGLRMSLLSGEVFSRAEVAWERKRSSAGRARWDSHRRRWFRVRWGV